MLVVSLKFEPNHNKSQDEMPIEFNCNSIARIIGCNVDDLLFVINKYFSDYQMNNSNFFLK